MTIRPGRHDSINVIDLFAGCGGFTQGFHAFRAHSDADFSPFRTIGAVEWDYAAASTYAANFGDEAGGYDHIFAGDIVHFSRSRIPDKVDVILGGPPCQGFSGLGKEDLNDPRNKLWREYVRIVNEFEPKIFVLENVDRFLRSPEYKALHNATTARRGKLRNYHLEAKVLSAADYGVPQMRRRAIVLATRRDLIEAHKKQVPLAHPVPTHRKPGADVLLGVEDLIKPWVVASEVFDRTPDDAPVTELPKRYGAPLDGDRPILGPYRTKDLHIGRNPTERSLARYESIPPGGNRWNIPAGLSTENWLNHRNGSGDVMGRMYMDRPAVTIRTEFYKPEKGRYLHPHAHRPITHYEAALLQGFPDDFLWYGSKVNIARQIGNAVPVGLAQAIAGAVFEYLDATGSFEGGCERKTA